MFMKKLTTNLLAFSVMITSVGVHSANAMTLFKKKEPFQSNQLQQAVSRETTVFAFDMHGVLMNWNWNAFGKQMFSHTMTTAVAGLATNYVTGSWKHGVCTRLAPILMVPTIALLSGISKKPIGYFYDTPLLSWIKNDYVNFAGCYKPNMDTFKIVQALKHAGYTVVLASNVDPDSLQDLKNRFPVLNIFDADYTPNQDNQWLDKHAPAKYFGDLKQKARGKQVVFIDDNTKNCRRAQEHAIEKAIHFSNAPQLAEDLRSLGLVIQY